MDTAIQANGAPYIPDLTLGDKASSLTKEWANMIHSTWETAPDNFGALSFIAQKASAIANLAVETADAYQAAREAILR